MREDKSTAASFYMRAVRDALTTVLALTGIALIFGVIWPTCRTFRSFDRLEQNAKRRISAAELQSWATNLLAHHPPEYARMSYLGTNFPQQLLGLYRRPPYVMIYESQTNNHGFIMAGWVRLTWGGGLIGHCGFEIGPTNFMSSKGGSAWAKGVYFWRD